MLSLLSLALPSGKAADAPRGMAERMATLEDKLAAMAFDAAANEVVITGANLRIVNGPGTTESMNGVGNLIVGYNELGNNPRHPDVRMGSHNIVVGTRLNFSSFGGLVVGDSNEISGTFASVSGGTNNTASGIHSSVSGGQAHTHLAKKLNRTIFAELTVPPYLLVFVLIRGGPAGCRLASQNRKSSSRVPTCRPGTSGKCPS
jgi:hypothetical protein